MKFCCPSTKRTNHPLSPLQFPGIKFTVEPKADAKYPIVSAASIVAKVTRDRAVVEATAAEAARAPDAPAALGSGYPGDPDTKAYLERSTHPVFGYTSLVRFSWSTTVRALEARAAKVGWEDDDDGAGAGQATLAFGAGGADAKLGRGVATSGVGRASYFRARRLALACL